MNSNIDLDLTDEKAVKTYVQNCIKKAEKIHLTVWAKHFLTKASERSLSLSKLYERKKQHYATYYGFLQLSQINGMTLKHFGIPHYCGEVSRDFLLAHSHLKKKGPSKKKNATDKQGLGLTDSFDFNEIMREDKMTNKRSHSTHHGGNICPSDCLVSQIRNDHCWTPSSQAPLLHDNQRAGSSTPLSDVSTKTQRPLPKKSQILNQNPRLQIVQRNQRDDQLGKISRPAKKLYSSPRDQDISLFQHETNADTTSEDEQLVSTQLSSINDDEIMLKYKKKLEILAENPVLRVPAVTMRKTSENLRTETGESYSDWKSKSVEKRKVLAEKFNDNYNKKTIAARLPMESRRKQEQESLQDLSKIKMTDMIARSKKRSKNKENVMKPKSSELLNTMQDRTEGNNTEEDNPTVNAGDMEQSLISRPEEVFDSARIFNRIIRRTDRQSTVSSSSGSTDFDTIIDRSPSNMPGATTHVSETVSPTSTLSDCHKDLNSSPVCDFASTIKESKAKKMEENNVKEDYPSVNTGNAEQSKISLDNSEIFNQQIWGTSKTLTVSSSSPGSSDSNTIIDRTPSNMPGATTYVSETDSSSTLSDDNKNLNPSSARDFASTIKESQAKKMKENNAKEDYPSINTGNTKQSEISLDNSEIFKQQIWGSSKSLSMLSSSSGSTDSDTIIDRTPSSMSGSATNMSKTLSPTSTLSDDNKDLNSSLACDFASTIKESGAKKIKENNLKGDYHLINADNVEKSEILLDSAGILNQKIQRTSKNMSMLSLSPGDSTDSEIVPGTPLRIPGARMQLPPTSTISDHSEPSLTSDFASMSRKRYTHSDDKLSHVFEEDTEERRSSTNTISPSFQSSQKSLDAFMLIDEEQSTKRYKQTCDDELLDDVPSEDTEPISQSSVDIESLSNQMSQDRLEEERLTAEKLAAITAEQDRNFEPMEVDTENIKRELGWDEIEFMNTEQSFLLKNDQARSSQSPSLISPAADSVDSSQDSLDDSKEANYHKSIPQGLMGSFGGLESRLAQLQVNSTLMTVDGASKNVSPNVSEDKWPSDNFKNDKAEYLSSKSEEDQSSQATGSSSSSLATNLSVPESRSSSQVDSLDDREEANNDRASSVPSLNRSSESSDTDATFDDFQEPESSKNADIGQDERAEFVSQKSFFKLLRAEADFEDFEKISQLHGVLNQSKVKIDVTQKDNESTSSGSTILTRQSLLSREGRKWKTEDFDSEKPRVETLTELNPNFQKDFSSHYYELPKTSESMFDIESWIDNSYKVKSDHTQESNQSSSILSFDSSLLTSSRFSQNRPGNKNTKTFSATTSTKYNLPVNEKSTDESSRIIVAEKHKEPSKVTKRLPLKDIQVASTSRNLANISDILSYLEMADDVKFREDRIEPSREESKQFGRKVAEKPPTKLSENLGLDKNDTAFWENHKLPSDADFSTSSSDLPEPFYSDDYKARCSPEVNRKEQQDEENLLKDWKTQARACSDSSGSSKTTTSLESIPSFITDDGVRSTKRKPLKEKNVKDESRTVANTNEDSFVRRMQSAEELKWSSDPLEMKSQASTNSELSGKPSRKRSLRTNPSKRRSGYNTRSKVKKSGAEDSIAWTSNNPSTKETTTDNRPKTFHDIFSNKDDDDDIDNYLRWP